MSPIQSQPMLLNHRLLSTSWPVVSNHKLVSVNNPRTTQSPLVFNSTDLELTQSNRIHSQHLVVMSVRVSAVWVKIGLTTVDITGTTMIILTTSTLLQMVAHTS